MGFQYLFNSQGEWIAFRELQHIYDNHGNWIGWLPWGNDEVATQEGEYLGTIVEANRFYYFGNRPHRSHPGNPSSPSYPNRPDRPIARACAVLPIGATDVASLKK